jgi:hypothetical protein
MKDFILGLVACWFMVFLLGLVPTTVLLVIVVLAYGVTKEFGH